MHSINSHSSLAQKRAVFLCIALFAAFLLIAVFRSSLHAVDVSVNLWMPTIQSDTTTIFAAGIDEFFDTNYLVLYSVVIAAVFFLGHQKQKGLLLFGALGGSALLVSIVKWIMLVPRPANALLFNFGYSFPSGHVAGIVVLAGVLAFFAWRYWQTKPARVSVACGYCGVVVMICFDRVHLNTHWFSDVFGSLLLGASWLTFVILLFRWLESRRKFQGRRFNVAANLLYIVALALAVLVVWSGVVV